MALIKSLTQKAAIFIPVTFAISVISSFAFLFYLQRADAKEQEPLRRECARLVKQGAKRVELKYPAMSPLDASVVYQVSAEVPGCYAHIVFPPGHSETWVVLKTAANEPLALTSARYFEDSFADPPWNVAEESAILIQRENKP